MSDELCYLSIYHIGLVSFFYFYIIAIGIDRSCISETTTNVAFEHYLACVRVSRIFSLLQNRSEYNGIKIFFQHIVYYELKCPQGTPGLLIADITNGKMKTSQFTLDDREYDNISFIAGLSLAISSSVFIGSSFIIKKVALKKISCSGNLRAAAGGYSYLKQWLWWLGLITMGIGEAANLLAYAFAPAALVTPLGALSVLVAAILSSKFLNEKLNFIGKIGCFLCIIGSVMFVIHSPKSEEVKTFPELTYMLCDYFFLSYVVVMFLMSFIIKVVFVPRFGNSNITVYLLLCSAIGSLTVVFCKAVALGIKESITGDNNNLTNYMFWLLLGTSIVCIMIQMNYLNKSLDIFNTSIVTPIYYVMFTVLVIIASGLLFKEWEHMSPNDILGCVCSFLVVMVAVFMLNAFRDIKISFRDINLNARHRRTHETLENGIGMLNHSRTENEHL